LEGFHIIVDAGNGAGGFFAVILFSSLSCGIQMGMMDMHKEFLL